MKRYISIFIAILCGIFASYAESISVADVTIAPGQTATTSISLTNTATNLVSFQMDLTLPEGVSINRAGCSLSSRFSDEDQELTIGKQSDNVYRLMSTSFSLTPISGTSGEIITLSLSASETTTGGTATLSNIRFVTSNSERVTIADASFNITVEVPSPAITFTDANVKALCVANWDTNGDGELSEAEAAAVTDLGEVFKGKTTITSFNELQYFTSLTTIGNNAFSGCTALTSVTIPNGVTTIGHSAFRDSGLETIAFPNSVTSIGGRAFDGCSNLTSVTMPASVITFDGNEGNAFGQNNNIEAVYISDLTAWLNTSFPMANNPLRCGARLYLNNVEVKDLVIPDGTTAILTAAFEGCESLTSVTIPSSVTSISGWAFASCGDLATVTIAESVTSIGEDAFKGCSSLTSIDIPNGITSIEHETFADCQALPSINIPNSVTSIGHDAFRGCSTLTSIVIPENVTSIGGHAFQNCYELTSANLPNGITTINEYLFCGCGKLESIFIPNSVTSIGDLAFCECWNLTSFTIPESVTSIGEYVFFACGLTDFYCYAENVPVTGSNAFDDSPISSATLHVPAASLEDYSTTAPWSGFGTIVEMPGAPITDLSELSNSELYTFNSCQGVLRVNGDVLETYDVLMGADNMGLVTSVSQLSSASTDPHEGSLEALLDNNTETFWHSNWHEGSVEAHSHYLQVELTESVSENICLQITRRPATNDHITLWGVYGSNSATAADSEWEELASISMPYATNTETRVSVPFDTKGYRYLRFYIDNTTGENNGSTRGYGHLSEFRLYTASDILNNVTAANDENCQFAILNISGNYYLYSPTKNAFWLAQGAFSPCVGSAVTFSDANAVGDYRWTVTMPLNDQTVSLNFAGLPYKITPVTSFNPTDALAAFIEGLEIGTTFTAPVPCGEGTTDLTFKVTSLSPWEVEVSASPEGIAGALTIPATVQNDSGYEFAVTAIGYEAFQDREGITSIVLPEGLTWINDRGFNACTNLASVILPSTLTDIYQGAFMNCVSLSTINIPAGVTTISLASFQNTPALRSIELHEGITKIGYDAFRGSGLESITFPTTLTLVGHNAFQDCRSLASIDFNHCPATFEYECFIGCSSLEELYIPNTVKFRNNDWTWSWSTFGHCYSLKTVVFEAFEENQRHWETGSLFAYCTALETVVLPSTNVMEWGFFDNCTSLSSVTLLEIEDGFDPRLRNFNKVYTGLDPNQIQFTVPAGTAETLLKAGYMHLSDKSGLPLVRSEFEAEATRIQAMADALTDGDKTALTTAISEARTIVNAAEDYAPVYAQITAIKNAAKTYLSTASVPANSDVTAAFVFNPDFERLQLGWSEQVGWAAWPNRNARGWNGATYEIGDIVIDKFIDVYDKDGDRTLSNGTIAQTITNLPAGIYRLECDAIATWQDDATVEVTGVNLFAGEETTAIATEDGKPQHFTVEFTQAEAGDCTIGIDINNTNANWVAMDNVRLYCLDVIDDGNTLYIPDITRPAGGRAILSINLRNTVPIETFNFDMSLPEGLNVATDRSGNPRVSLSTRRTTQSAHVLSTTILDDGSLRVQVSAPTAETFSGNDGEVLQIALNIDADIEWGTELPIILKDITITDNAAEVHNIERVTSHLTIASYKLGDLNGDGRVNSGDYTALVHYQLGLVLPSTFVEAATDVNGDGSVNSGDLTGIIHLCLYESLDRPTTQKSVKKQIMLDPQ